MANAASRVAKWFISLGIGVFFAWLTLKDWPIEDLTEGLTFTRLNITSKSFSVHVSWLFIYFLTLVPMHIFRVWRWSPLLRPLVRVDFWTLNRVSSVGFLAMFLLPFRLGELVRPALLASEAPIRRSPALATVVVERTVDGVLVAGFLAISLLFLPRTNSGTYHEIQVASYAALGIFASLVGLLVLVFAFRRRILLKAKPLLLCLSGRRVGGVLAGILERFLEGLSIFPDWKNFFLFLLGSLGYWGSNCTGLYILSLGFGLDIPFVAAVAMMATVVVGMMIPNPPGNVGTFWYFMLKPLELHGLSGQPVALAFAFAVYGLQLLQLVIFGGWFILLGQISFKRAFTVSFKDLEG